MMVIPRKVNFTQMGRYCKRGEPTQMEIAKVCGLEKAGLVYYFPFKQNSFGYCAQNVFHPLQLEKKFQFTAGSFPEFIDQYYGRVIFALIRLRLVCVTPK